MENPGKLIPSRKMSDQSNFWHPVTHRLSLVSGITISLTTSVHSTLMPMMPTPKKWFDTATCTICRRLPFVDPFSGSMFKKVPAPALTFMYFQLHESKVAFPRTVSPDFFPKLREKNDIMWSEKARTKGETWLVAATDRKNVPWSWGVSMNMVSPLWESGEPSSFLAGHSLWRLWHRSASTAKVSKILQYNARVSSHSQVSQICAASCKLVKNDRWKAHSFSFPVRGIFQGHSPSSLCLQVPGTWKAKEQLIRRVKEVSFWL